MCKFVNIKSRMFAPDVASRPFGRQPGERSRQFSPRLRTQEGQDHYRSSSSQQWVWVGGQRGTDWLTIAWCQFASIYFFGRWEWNALAPSRQMELQHKSSWHSSNIWIIDRLKKSRGPSRPPQIWYLPQASKAGACVKICQFWVKVLTLRKF